MADIVRRSARECTRNAIMSGILPTECFEPLLLSLVARLSQKDAAHPDEKQTGGDDVDHGVSSPTSYRRALTPWSVELCCDVLALLAEVTTELREEFCVRHLIPAATLVAKNEDFR